MEVVNEKLCLLHKSKKMLKQIFEEVGRKIEKAFQTHYEPIMSLLTGYLGNKMDHMVTG